MSEKRIFGQNPRPNYPKPPAPHAPPPAPIDQRLAVIFQDLFVHGSDDYFVGKAFEKLMIRGEIARTMCASVFDQGAAAEAARQKEFERRVISQEADTSKPPLINPYRK